MRICLYTETALPKIGGHELVVDALARQFQELGQEVLVLAPHPRLPLWASDHVLPYPVVRHPRFFSTRFLVDWYQWWLLRLYRRFPFDVLHCQGVYPPGYLATRTRNRLGAPVIITSHGGDVRVAGIRLRKPVVRRRQTEALQAADALIAISRFTEEGYRRFGADPKTIVRIPNGVDPKPFANRVVRPAGLDPAIGAGRYVLFLGRLKERKGVDILLQALQYVPGSAQDGVQLVIAGEGEERESLQQMAGNLGIQDRVRFVGAVHGVKKVYLLQNACCTVMPSRIWEAFPLVVLESFAAATPVLAAQVPGLEDLIEPGRNGWLVPPESPLCLGTALTAILTDTAETNRLGAQASQGVQDFSWTAVAQRHLELYRELLAQRVGRRAQ